jgi:predicted metal-binding membrane protein
LVPVLRRHRGAIRVAGDAHANRSIALVGAGYFAVWTVFGAIAFPLGVALAAIEMEHPALARAVPTAVGVVVGIAGTVQLTAWKSRRLAACRNAIAQGAALRRGVRLGLECVQCCANWMAILLVVGVMDLGAMAVVAVAITAERLAPNGQRVARVAGLVAVAAGSILIARAVGIE